MISLTIEKKIFSIGDSRYIIILEELPARYKKLEYNLLCVELSSVEYSLTHLESSICKKLILIISSRVYL